MTKIYDYDRARNKRLAALLPVSLIFLFIIMISLEEMQVIEKLYSVGYEGPMELIPEISIIDEHGIESDVTAEERRALVAQNVEVESEQRERSEDPLKETSEVNENVPEELTLDEEPGPDLYRSYRAHAEVPYREDYVILRMVKPEYPPDALELGLEGYVVTEVYVDEEGKVMDAYVRSAYGPVTFEESSLEAVKQFLFKPILEDGKPKPFWISFLIRFKCNR